MLGINLFSLQYVCVCVGGVLWYFHVYKGSGHFLGLKILNFIFLGAFKKKNWGVQRFCGYFWGGHHKIGLYLGTNSIHFRVFS